MAQTELDHDIDHQEPKHAPSGELPTAMDDLALVDREIAGIIAELEAGPAAVGPELRAAWEALKHAVEARDGAAVARARASLDRLTQAGAGRHDAQRRLGQWLDRRARLAPEGDTFARAKAAVSELRGHGRRPDGTAGAGNTLALRHGLRSARLLEAPDVAEWHCQQVDAITADLGGEAELSALKTASVREVARLEVILGALGDELLAGGVLTGKGKMRSATVVYLQALDRFARLCATLGLERRPREVRSFTDAIRQEPRRA